MCSPSLSPSLCLRLCLCLCSAQPAATFELYKALPTTTTTAELYEITICNNSNSNSYSYAKFESSIFSLRRSVKRSHQISVLNIVLSVQINFMKRTNIVLENERAINTATTITKNRFNEQQKQQRRHSRRLRQRSAAHSRSTRQRDLELK